MHKEVAPPFDGGTPVENGAGLPLRRLPGDLMVCVCGVGKVNAALAAQYLIDRFAPAELWNAGVSGCFHDLPAGTVVAATHCVQHDLDVFGDPPGLVPVLERVELPCAKAEETLARLSAAGFHRGFLLLPLIWNAAGGIVNAFAQVGAMVAALILWCMLTDGARRTHTSPTLLFSLALIVTNAAMLAGTLLGAAQAQNIRPGDVALTAVALVSVYLLLIAAIVLFRNREGGSAFQAPPPSDGESAPSIEVAPTPEEVLATRCAALAERYGLTPRERDIFPLLAQGHTMPAISERLFVSENTVKSHAKRIYQKLGIHARAELIDLVNRTGDEDAARER